MKHQWACALLGLAAIGAGLEGSAAETTDLIDVNAAARIDWDQIYYDGDTQDDLSGLKAKYVFLKINGQIADGLTYGWRQRLSKYQHDSSFLDATDWLYVDYATKGWHFQGGKQVVLIGSYEYDRNPIDIFQFSVFSYNISCFQLGASAGYDLGANDRLTVQVNQSPFFTSENRNLYAANLYWQGSHGVWKPIWSVNMMQYAAGRWINYVALGNRFDFSKVWLELDLMHRYISHGGAFKDYSAVGNVGYDVNERWTIHAKASYDRNSSSKPGDYCVMPGTSLKMVGAGLEYYPIKRADHKLRLHAMGYYSWGENGNSADLMQDHTWKIGAGLTWEMNLFRK